MFRLAKFSDGQSRELRGLGNGAHLGDVKVIRNLNRYWFFACLVVVNWFNAGVTVVTMIACCLGSQLRQNSDTARLELDRVIGLALKPFSML